MLISFILISKILFFTLTIVIVDINVKLISVYSASLSTPPLSSLTRLCFISRATSVHQGLVYVGEKESLINACRPRVSVSLTSCGVVVGAYHTLHICSVCQSW